MRQSDEVTGEVEVTSPSVSAGDPTDAAATKEIVHGFYESVNASRWDDVVRFFHDDAVLLVPSQLPKVGRGSIVEFCESHGRRFPEHHDDVSLIMLDGSRVMTLAQFEGVDRNGTAVRFCTAGVFTIEDRRIRQARVLFDTAQLTGPAPPGTREPREQEKEAG